MGGESTNRGGWGPPPSHSGRLVPPRTADCPQSTHAPALVAPTAHFFLGFPRSKPMERSFQDAILREERSRKNWVSAWGNMEEGVAKKAVGPASSPFDLDRAARLNLRNVYRVPSMSGHHVGSVDADARAANRAWSRASHSPTSRSRTRIPELTLRQTIPWFRAR